jgi:hypothetical protein
MRSVQEPRRRRYNPIEPTTPSPTRPRRSELGSGTADTPGIKLAPSVVPKENIAAVMVVSALTFGAVIVNVAD